VSVIHVHVYYTKQDAVLSQGGPRDAAVNFDTYRILQQHREASAMARLSCWSLSADCSELSVKKWQVLERTSQIAYLTQTSNHVITLNYYKMPSSLFTINVA